MRVGEEEQGVGPQVVLFNLWDHLSMTETDHAHLLKASERLARRDCRPGRTPNSDCLVNSRLGPHRA